MVMRSTAGVTRPGGGQSSVARSYRYPVIDHYVVWIIPRGYTMMLIEGVVTALPRGSNTRRDPIECYVPEKSKGYTGKWQRYHLYRDVHARTATKARQLYRDRILRDWQNRHQRHADDERLKGRWISVTNLKEVGACDPGINSARKIAEQLLGAHGEIGAVNAYWAAQQSEKWRVWAHRAIK